MRSLRMIGETPRNSDGDDKSLPLERESLVEEAGHDTAPREHGGRDGPEPTRYGDWEKNGRCIDF